MENIDVARVLDALETFINARPDLDLANYGCHPEQLAYSSKEQKRDAWRALRGDKRTIARDGTRARKALREARALPASAAALEDAFRSAFSGRLTWREEACTCKPCPNCFNDPVVCALCGNCIREGKHAPGCEGCPKGKGHLDYCTGQYYPTEYRAAAATVLEHYCHTVRPKFTPEAGTLYTHVSQIISASNRAGSHYFSRGAMRFFRSRVLSQVMHGPGGVYFVTSEKGPNEIRRFTVRKFDPVTADIDTFGPFNELTREKALRVARIAAHYPEAAKEILEN